MDDSTAPASPPKGRHRFLTEYGEQSHFQVFLAVALVVVMAIGFAWGNKTPSLTHRVVVVSIANVLLLIVLGLCVRIRWVLLTTLILAGVYYGIYTTLT